MAKDLPDDFKFVLQMKSMKKKLVIKAVEILAIVLVFVVSLILVAHFHEKTHEAVCANFDGNPVRVGENEVKCFGLSGEDFARIESFYAQLEITTFVMVSVLYLTAGILIVWVILRRSIAIYTLLLRP